MAIRSSAPSLCESAFDKSLANSAGNYKKILKASALSFTTDATGA
jgi:hypothetical protein